MGDIQTTKAAETTRVKQKTRTALRMNASMRRARLPKLVCPEPQPRGFPEPPMPASSASAAAESILLTKSSKNF